MKLIQMQFSPDAFDNFIKGKLNEVEVDPSLAEDFWNKMDSDLTKKKGFTVGRRFIYLFIGALFLSSIFYLTYDELSELAVKEKAIKQTPAIIESKDSQDDKFPDDELNNKSLTELRRPVKNTAKAELNNADEVKAYAKINRTKTFTTAAPSSGIIKPLNTEIAIPDRYKIEMQATPVIPKDSLRIVAPATVVPTKKKTPVTIIW